MLPRKGIRRDERERWRSSMSHRGGIVLGNHSFV
jgi:hypothetical protein